MKSKKYLQLVAKAEEGRISDKPSAHMNPDAGEGARSKEIAPKSTAPTREKLAVNRGEGLGGLIGAKGTQIGASGLGTRGGGGTVTGLGGLGTKGAARGVGDYSSAASRSTPPPPANGVEEEDEVAPENTAIANALNTGTDAQGMMSANPLSEEELEASI